MTKIAVMMTKATTTATKTTTMMKMIMMKMKMMMTTMTMMTTTTTTTTCGIQSLRRLTPQSRTLACHKRGMNITCNAVQPGDGNVPLVFNCLASPTEIILQMRKWGTESDKPLGPMKIFSPL